MTPTTLYSDRQLFVSFYKNTFSRLKGVALLYGIMMFITFPMFYCINIAEAMERIALGKNYYGFDGHLDIYPPAALFFFAIIVGAVISLSAIAYSFMHSKKSVDVFHALPIKRPAMLTAGFGAVISWMFILEAVCYLTVGVVSAFTVPVPIEYLLAEVIRVFVLTAAIAAIAAFCAVCCNTVLDSAIFTLAFNAMVPCYTLLIFALLGEFIAGFSGRTSPLIPRSLMFSPVCMLYQTYYYEDVAYTLLTNLIYIAFIAAVMAAGCVIYVKRKSEKAQSNNVSGVLYRFILLASSVGGGAFFGFVLSELFGWGGSYRKTVTIILLSCLFTAVICLVFNAVTSRRVNPGKKGLVWLAASIAITCGLFASITNGFFGMESYLPALDSIQSVKLFYGGEYEDISRYVKTEEGKYRYIYGANEGVVFEDTEEIAFILGMHSDIVDNIIIDGKTTPRDYYANHRFEVEYTLKNGRKITRNYYREVTESVTRDLMAVEDMETFKRQLVPMLLSPASDLDKFTIKDGFGRNQQELKLSDAEKELLYNAIAQDVLNTTSQMKKQHSEMSLAKIQLDYRNIRTYQNGVEFTADSYTPSVAVAEKEMYNIQEYEPYEYELYTPVCFEVTSATINTIKALNQLGLTQYTQLTQPQDMRAIVTLDATPFYASQTANFWLASKRFEDYGFADNINYSQRKETYYDEQQIAQLADSCTSTVYIPSVKDEPPVFAVAFTGKDTDLSSVYQDYPEVICYYMTYEDAPQFVKDDFAQQIENGCYLKD